ncbi:MAG: AsmA-like C-terminal region-containing protein [Alistipes sp.]|nr:AsmA-like C-terminal region-containing protein [Alistipes sp.]
MKKLIKIVGGTLVVLVLLLMILPMVFKGKIEGIVKSEGNKLLNTQFDFESLDISLLRNFPQASVSLNDFWLKGIDVFENDTLVYAGELTAAVNVMSLFGDGGFEVSKIIVDDTRLHAIVLEDGKVNWDVMKPSEPKVEEVEEQSEESSSLSISLKKLSVDDLTLIYDDRQGGMYAEVRDLDAACSGDMTSDNTTIRLKAETPSVTFKMGGVPFLSRAKVGAKMDVDADLKNMKFTLRDNALSLNAIEAAIDGWLAMGEESMDMDLKLNTNEIGFKEILSLIPAIYAKDFAGLKTDGVATLNAYAKGKMEGEKLPEFNVDLNVKNAMFRYPSLPAGVDGINIVANVKNPGGTADATTVVVNPFNFTLAGNPFSILANVKTPISDLNFNAAAKGKLDLGKIKDVYPLEDMNLNGVVDADMSVAGAMSMIDKGEYDRVQAAGNIKLSDMQLELKDMPKVDIKQSTFSFEPRYMELSQTRILVGDNDVTLDSRFENYLGFVFKGSTLKGTLNVSSQKMNLNDFMSEGAAEEAAPAEQEQTTEEQAEEAMGVIRVPENIDFRMQADFKQVLFGKMNLTDVKGLLIVKDSKVDMQNLSLNAMGGSVVVNGAYATPAAKNPRLNAGFALNNIGFAQAYKELDMVRSLAPIFSNLNGNFSGSVKVDTELDEQMSPVMNTLNGSGSLSTKDLGLGNVQIINLVADIVKKPALKDTKVKNLNLDFTINNGRVTTKPFEVKLGDYVMNLSGTTGLDQTIDYKGKITLPASAGAVAKLGTVDMTIGGTFASPKVGIDMESLAKQAAQQAASGLVDKLLGGKKENASGEAADSTATPSKAEQTKDAIKAIGSLFKKKSE